MISKIIRHGLKNAYDSLIVREAHKKLIDYMEHNTPLDDEVLDLLHQWGIEDDDLQNASHILIDACTAIMAVDYEFYH
jgi:hypothetical protein